MSIGIGDALRQAREEQGRAIEDAARDTRVRGDYLRALESEEFDVFGGDVYAKGFLSSYARYLNLDPQPLLDDYRQHVQHDEMVTSALVTTSVTRQPSKPPPTWLAWVVVAAVVVIGAGALAQFGGRTPEPAVRQTPTPGPTDPVTTEPPTEAATEPEAEPTFDGVELLLALEERSWLRVTVDGSVQLENVVEAGESLPFSGEDEIVVRFGNAGGVRAELNGRDLGTQGAQGEVRTVTFTPDGPQPDGPRTE